MNLLELSRKTIIIILIIILALILILSGVFFIIYTKRNSSHHVQYNESGDVNYNVAVKENEYFKDATLEKNKQYIASLIDKINADFKYNLSLSEDIKYNYKYNIMAYVNVRDNNTNKEIYSNSEELVQEVVGQSSNELNINQNVEIDYNKYNNLISEFVTVYNLKNVTSKVTAKMFVEIDGDEQKFEKEKTVVSIDIPLTTNTVAIDIKKEVSNNSNNYIELKSNYTHNEVFLAIGIILLLVDIGVLIGLIIYIKKTETEEDKYKGELKKILNNYGSYISQVEDEFDMKEYQILKVPNFIDLLEIRDTMQIPIIMIENKESLTSCFIIPTASKILYFYSLGVKQYALPTTNIENKESELEEVDVQKV